MSNEVLPPPQAPACLWRLYSSNPQQKGGTLIAVDVHDVETHERRLRSPDGYRPDDCPRCGHGKLHGHDYRERKVAGLTLIRYRCPKCTATWLILPRFVAPKLWRSWPVVEAKTLNPQPTLDIPRRTVVRWRARLKTTAHSLLELLRDKARVVLASLSSVADRLVSRRQLVSAYAEDRRVDAGQQLAAVAAVLHKAEPGVRLM